MDTKTSQQANDGAAAAVEGDHIAEVVDYQRIQERLQLAIYRDQEEQTKKELAETERYYKEFGQSIEKQKKTLAKISDTANKMLQLARQLDNGTDQLTRSINRWKNLLEERARGAVMRAVPDSSGQNFYGKAGVEVNGYLIPQLRPINQAVNIALDDLKTSSSYAEKLAFALNRLKEELGPEMKDATFRNAPPEMERLGKRQKTDNEWAANPYYDEPYYRHGGAELSDDSNDSDHR
jgi:hypothetical protein